MKEVMGCQKSTKTGNSAIPIPKTVPSPVPEPEYPAHKTLVIHDSYNAKMVPKKYSWESETFSSFRAIHKKNKTWLR